MLVHENLIHLLILLSTKQEWVSRLLTLLTIFSPEELSIQRFENLGGNHLRVTLMCIWLRVTTTLLHLEVHGSDTDLSQKGKNLRNLKNPNHLIFRGESNPDTKACKGQRETQLEKVGKKQLS